MHDTARPDTRAPTAPRLAFTALVALAEAVHLGWEHAHGGIVSHHLLNDASLPALWNGWGLVLLPAMAWMASRHAFRASGTRWIPERGFLLHLVGGLLAGLALAVAFSVGGEKAAGIVFPAIVLAALVVRAYRIEYLLGFALGMAFTFGGLLPVLIGGCIALVSIAAWFGLWPLLRRVAVAVRARGTAARG